VSTRTIVPTDIRVEDRRGSEILVVEDQLGQEFSNFFKDEHEDVLRNVDKYVGNPWTIQYSEQGGLFDFYGFVDRAEPEDVATDRIEKSTSGGRDQEKINRMNGQGHAAKIVAAKLQAGAIGSGGFEPGADVDDLDEEIVEELAKYQEVFRHHRETGEYTVPSGGENQ
jgi:hypothetical protein